MTRNSVVLLVVAAISMGLIATGMVVGGNEPQPNVVWEYRTLRIQGPFTDAEPTLDEYGKNGWEVVDWERTNFFYFLLKRQAVK